MESSKLISIAMVIVISCVIFGCGLLVVNQLVGTFDETSTAKANQTWTGSNTTPVYLIKKPVKSIDYVYNYSGYPVAGAILASNYTTVIPDAHNFEAQASVRLTDDNGTGNGSAYSELLQVNYTYYIYSESANASNKALTGMASLSGWFGLLVLIGMMLIVLAIVLALGIGRKNQGSGGL